MKLVHDRSKVGKDLRQRLLAPASFVYTAGAFCRLLAYKVGAIPRHKPPATVLSVGNLTVGGTGKTPVVVDLANRALLAGFKPGILSRGYKRKSTDATIVVSDGEEILTSCEVAGDEPYLIATKTKGCVVIVGADRLSSAKVAIERYDCDLIILDDGFQHVKIVRDIDMVLIDYNDEIGQDKVVPAGRLREPLAALNRASSVVITKVPPKPDLQRLENISKVVHDYCPHANISLARFQHRGFFKYQYEAPPGSDLSSDMQEHQRSGERGGGGRSEAESRAEERQRSDGALKDNTLKDNALKNGVRISSVDLRFIRLFAFSGIARPELFYNQLKEQGLDIAAKHSFGDHHWYSRNDVKKLVAAATKHKAGGLICTEKDLVKIAPFLENCGLPIYAPAQETEWIGRLPVAVEELLTAERQKNLVKT